MGTVRYTVIDGEVVSELRGGVKRDYVPDPLGSTVALLDSSQAKTDTFEYWPYGESAGRTGTTATPFQYIGVVGYYHDGTARNYVRARYLDKGKGCWITQDLIMDDISISNQYEYCYKNPVNYFDYTGLRGGLITTRKCNKQETKRCNDLAANKRPQGLWIGICTITEYHFGICKLEQFSCVTIKTGTGLGKLPPKRKPPFVDFPGRIQSEPRYAFGRNPEFIECMTECLKEQNSVSEWSDYTCYLKCLPKLKVGGWIFPQE
jgi:RHS repeat-associated protein